MMKHIIFIFLFYTWLPLLISQPNTSLGDSLREEGLLSEAVEAYKQQIQTDGPNKGLWYNLACAYALDWKTDSAFHYLNLSAEGDTSVRPLGDPDLLFLTRQDAWESYENAQIQKVEAKYGNYENLDLSKTLWRMKMKDQAYYYHIQLADKKMGRNSPVSKGLWSLKHILNDENLEALTAIIDEQGWPKRSVVKGNAASAVFLVIQHADLETQKKYIPLLKGACEADEAAWQDYALMYDRIEMREGREQVYGSQITYNKDTKLPEPHPIKDPEYVNKRRKEVGLGPIQDYLSHWGIEWTIEQKDM